MTAYSMGMLETCRAMVTGARPEDLDDVLACTKLVLGYIQHSCTAVAAAYLDERRRMDSDEQRRRYMLMSALLRGEALADPVHQAIIRLPPRGQVDQDLAAVIDQSRTRAASIAAGRVHLTPSWPRSLSACRQPGGKTEAGGCRWDGCPGAVGIMGSVAPPVLRHRQQALDLMTGVRQSIQKVHQDANGYHVQ